MRDLQRGIVWGIFLGVLGMFVVPAGILAVRVADTWQAGYTEQVLGAFTAICGGGIVIVAALMGAGLYIRLSAGVRPRREADPPYVVGGGPASMAGYGPPGPALPSPAEPTPPWGATGGGQYALLPVNEGEFVLDPGSGETS